MFEQVSLELGGRTLTLETGKMARQAHGAIVARYVGIYTVVLATACMDNKATEKDFLPLTVDYREYTYSGGKIPGGFFKREGRPTEREILTSRLTDRPLRPLFPEGWATETQIVAMVLSADSENDPDVKVCRYSGVRRTVHFENSFQQPDSLRACGIAGWQAGGQPDRRAAEGEPSEHHRRRHGRSRGDGGIWRARSIGGDGRRRPGIRRTLKFAEW